MRYAQLDRDGTRIATFLDGNPDDWPDLRDAGVLQACGPEVSAGWVWDGKEFAPPVTTPGPRIIPPLDFRRRFTPAERGAITLAASRGLEGGKPALQVWLDDLISATALDLDSAELRAALDMLVASGLLATDRRAEIVT